MHRHGESQCLGAVEVEAREIDPGSRHRIGPHHEAGYTSAVVTEPEFVKAVAIWRGPYTSTYDLTDKEMSTTLPMSPRCWIN